MKSSVGFIVIVFSFLGLQNVANSATKNFSYRVEAAASSYGCDGQTAKVIGALSQISNLKVTNQSCHTGNAIVDNGHKYYRNIITVDYSADQEALPARARFSSRETFGDPLDGTGVFPKYADCLEAIPLEEQTFQNETQTRPAASYCLPSFDSTFPGYSLVIEGFGKPVRKLFLYSNERTVNYPSPVNNSISLLIQKGISEGGGHIVKVESNLIFYYSAEAFLISTLDIGGFSEAAQCEVQRGEALSIYTKRTLKSVSALCAGNNELIVVGTGTDGLYEDYSSNSPRYFSFSDCINDRERMVSNGNGTGRKVLGGICKPSTNYTGEFAVTLYYGLN
jgi:hypothetical protein